MDSVQTSSVISIVMSTYNTPFEYLKKSVESVLEQTFTNFEFIIIDDGSIESKGIKWLEALHDHRIILIHNRHDFIESLNRGINKCKGKYIARMDADDIMMPNRLQVQYDFMEGGIRKLTFAGLGWKFLAIEEVFTVVPDSAYQIIGKAMLPIARSGKVKMGQKVNIHLQNFPENEYGILRGTVQHISLTPAQTGETAYYSVEITLPNGLITTYKKELPYLPNMQGQADIITEDLSLLERLALPIKMVLKENN